MLLLDLTNESKISVYLTNRMLAAFDNVVYTGSFVLHVLAVVNVNMDDPFVVVQNNHCRNSCSDNMKLIVLYEEVISTTCSLVKTYALLTTI